MLCIVKNKELRLKDCEYSICKLCFCNHVQLYYLKNLFDGINSLDEESHR